MNKTFYCIYPHFRNEKTETKKGYLSTMSKVMHFAKHSSPGLSNSKTYAAHQSTPVPYTPVFKFDLSSELKIYFPIKFTPLAHKKVNVLAKLKTDSGTVIPGEI